jgi:hypothetical protein
MDKSSINACFGLPSRRSGHALRVRVLLLLACLSVGAVVGFVGEAITGSPTWYLAIPAAVALGWLVVADPAECEGGGCALGPSKPPRGDA